MVEVRSSPVIPSDLGRRLPSSRFGLHVNFLEHFLVHFLVLVLLEKFFVLFFVSFARPELLKPFFFHWKIKELSENVVQTLIAFRQPVKHAW